MDSNFAKLSLADKETLVGHLPMLVGKKILVLGDVGVDEYVMGQVRRISPEAPVPVLDVEANDVRLGLAANVAQNIASLGGIPILISAGGGDSGAEILRGLCEKRGVVWDHIVVDHKRPTTRKVRIMTGHHHLVRVDYELKQYLSQQIENELLKKVENCLDNVDGVIIEDYAKGVVSKAVVERVAAMCKRAGKKLMVDPNINHPISHYKGVDLLKPNFNEALALSGFKSDDLRANPDKIYEMGRVLQEAVEAREVVLTRGQDGMTIFSNDKMVTVPTYARNVFDVTGAGDTVIAALALGVVSGLSLVHSSMLANNAAGVVVGKVGCVPCEINELREYIETAH